MFKSNQKQLINILKQGKQLKIDYQILKNQTMQKQETSSFIIQNENIPNDAVLKIQTLENNITDTYITSLYRSPNQTIEQIVTSPQNGNKKIKLYENFYVVSDEEDIENESQYFKNCGIDYLISPLTVLYEAVKEKVTKNSLNVLIHDNTMTIIIFDKEREAVLGTIKELTPFENVKESNFYDDEIIGQKLYDEVHFLEIQQSLSDLTQQYYQDSEDVDFLTEANILYSIGQLSEEQIESLHETLMAEINYEQISLENKLYEITIKPTVQEYSFTKARAKHPPKGKTKWIMLLIFSIILTAGTLYYKSLQDKKALQQKKQIEEKATKAQPKPAVKPKPAMLVNHTLKNNNITNQTLMLFDMIPYDAILKELEIKPNSSTIVCNFVADSNSTVQLQEKLLKIYNSSKVILKHENKESAVLSTIITNEGLKPAAPIEEKKLLKYKELKFIPISKVITYLQSTSLPDTKVKFLTKEQKDFTTYNFELISVVNSPKVFFDYVAELNKKDFSININYPLDFGKTKEGIVIKYNIQFHQYNKKSLQTK